MKKSSFLLFIPVLLILVVGVYLSACHKSRDGFDPYFIITSPAQNDTLILTDPSKNTLFVMATAYSEKEFKNVQILINDTDSNPIFSYLPDVFDYEAPQGGEHTTIFRCMINTKWVPNRKGIYYVVFQAPGNKGAGLQKIKLIVK